MRLSANKSMQPKQKIFRTCIASRCMHVGKFSFSPARWSRCKFTGASHRFDYITGLRLAYFAMWLYGAGWGFERRSGWLVSLDLVWSFGLVGGEGCAGLYASHRSMFRDGMCNLKAVGFVDVRRLDMRKLMSSLDFESSWSVSSRALLSQWRFVKRVVIYYS